MLSSASSVSRMVEYFVRDDDVGELTDELRAFVQVFLSRKIPVSYQIIPARFTEDCATFMRQAATAYPELIEFGQHGLHHAMSWRGKELKREFGPERSLIQQEDDIKAGLALLSARLGDEHNVTLFTPPQHKFDRNTVLAAANCGHSIFSAANYPTPHHQLAYAVGRWMRLSSVAHHGISYHAARRPEAELREISISIAVDNGRGITCDAAHLARAIRRAKAVSGAVGLMFHHAVYAGPSANESLIAIANTLEKLPRRAFRKIGDISTD